MPLAQLENGIELFWDERGEGPPIVLVMGIGAQMILWPEGFCDMLAERGFRVIRFDNRDVGLSSRLDHLGVPPLGPTLVGSLLGMRVDAPYVSANRRGWPSPSSRCPRSRSRRACSTRRCHSSTISWTTGGQRSRRW